MKRIGILLTAALLFLSAGCGKKEEIKVDKLTAHQEKILSYLPGETQFIMYMNLNGLRDTKFWDDYFNSVLNQNPGSTWLEEFEKETGAGIKDGAVEFITTGSWRGNDVSVITFDKNLKEIKKYFDNKNKFAVVDVSGKKVFQFKDKSSGYYYFPDDSTLMMINNREYLNSLVSSEHKSLVKGSSLFPIIKSIRHKGQYWIATDEGTYASGIIKNLVSSYNKLPGKKLINSIKNITLSARFDEGIKIDSDWGCEDAKSAYLLSSAIKGALAMDLLAGKDEALNQVLQKMEIDQDQQKINFEIQLTKNDLSDIKSFAKKNQLDKKL